MSTVGTRKSIHPPERLINAKQIAKMLEIPLTDAHTLMALGFLPSFLVHTSLWARKRDVEYFLEAKKMFERDLEHGTQTGDPTTEKPAGDSPKGEEDEQESHASEEVGD